MIKLAEISRKIRQLIVWEMHKNTSKWKYAISDMYRS